MEKDPSQVKRPRGAPPGNKNAAGNRGNRAARGARGNRGGRGAPIGNQYARRRRAAHQDLLKRYGRDPELAAWITAHADRLDTGDFTADDTRDRAFHDMARMGVTLDEVLSKGWR